jgi:hypothetical protein
LSDFARLMQCRHVLAVELSMLPLRFPYYLIPLLYSLVGRPTKKIGRHPHLSSHRRRGQTKCPWSRWPAPSDDVTTANTDPSTIDQLGESIRLLTSGSRCPALPTRGFEYC